MEQFEHRLVTPLIKRASARDHLRTANKKLETVSPREVAWSVANQPLPKNIKYITATVALPNGFAIMGSGLLDPMDFRYGLRPGRLLSVALAKGLGDAVSRNDESAADRYRRRLRMMAGQFDTNPAISEALDRLLSAIEHWSATKVTERYKAERQVPELIERLVELL